MTIVEVRKYGTKTAFIGRKGPADAVNVTYI